MTAASLSLSSSQMSVTDSVKRTFRDGIFKDNLQEQRDEILALQSIFNTEGDEKLKILSEVSEDNDGLFTLLITVCPKPTHDTIRVELAFPTRQDDNLAAAAAPVNNLCPPSLGSNVQLNRSASGWHWQGSFSVKYLSPLYLQTTLPPSYPSKDPPEFHLSCGWLNLDQLTTLSHAMDTLWAESSQMSIIYSWVHWLEHEILSHLGITDQLVLQTSLAQVEVDGSQDVHVDEDIGEIIACLIRYNQEQMDIEFCRTMQECHVCYCEKLGEHFFRLHDCKHHYCHDCMAEFCEVHVREGTVEALRCPDRECNTIIPPYIVQAVMGPEAYMRWEQLLLQKTLDAMSDTLYCPRCNSLVIAEAEEELHLARCPVCYFAFCTQCERGWHQGRNCLTDQDVLEDLQNRGQTVMNKDEEKKLQELMKKFEREIETKKIFTKMKNCPSCKVRVEKNGGCNKMTCKCGKSFCWVCGKLIAGYEHFAPGANCKLTPELVPQVVVPIGIPPEGALRIQARIELNPVLNNNRILCPICKQLNLKGLDHNNHIKCWNCKGNFCFQCKQRIAGNNIMLHFKGPCVQHS